MNYIFSWDIKIPNQIQKLVFSYATLHWTLKQHNIRISDALLQTSGSRQTEYQQAVTKLNTAKFESCRDHCQILVSLSLKRNIWAHSSLTPIHTSLLPNPKTICLKLISIFLLRWLQEEKLSKLQLKIKTWFTSLLWAVSPGWIQNTECK